MTGSSGTRPAKDAYQVAVKAFLERDNSFLIFEDRFGDWDLPGGRLLGHEFNTPLTEVLGRKLAEELGNAVRYEIGAPLVFMRHERIETAGPVRIFAIGYNVKCLGGEIRLSGQHRQLEWVSIDDFEPDARFTGGWLSGVRDFLALRRARA